MLRYAGPHGRCSTRSGVYFIYRLPKTVQILWTNSGLEYYGDPYSDVEWQQNAAGEIVASIDTFCLPIPVFGRLELPSVQASSGNILNPSINSTPWLTMGLFTNFRGLYCLAYFRRSSCKFIINCIPDLCLYVSKADLAYTQSKYADRGLAFEDRSGG